MIKSHCSPSTAKSITKPCGPRRQLDNWELCRNSCRQNRSIFKTPCFGQEWMPRQEWAKRLRNLKVKELKWSFKKFLLHTWAPLFYTKKTNITVGRNCSDEFSVSLVPCFQLLILFESNLLSWKLHICQGNWEYTNVSNQFRVKQGTTPKTWITVYLQVLREPLKALKWCGLSHWKQLYPTQQ